MQEKSCVVGGFTLIELLVVILIIGILAAIALPQYQYAVEKSRLAGAMQTVSDLQKAVDLWVLENGFPSSGIYLIGNNSPVRLDLEVTGSMDCSVKDGRECASSNFSFEVFCQSSNCGIYAYRFIGNNHDMIDYAFQKIKYSSNGVWAEDECDYYEGQPYGESICKELEAQHGYQSCYEC